MKQVLFLIILIGWGILQARRKAMREQRRQQAEIASEPVAAAATPSSNWPPVTDEPDRFLQQMEADVPESIRPLFEAARKPKRKKSKPVEPEEPVERIVADIPVVEVSAYDAVAPVRRRIRFDKEALQAFMVTREVLGPPRAKRPHRPGIRNR
jgi:hypothetical protein